MPERSGTWLPSQAREPGPSTSPFGALDVLSRSRATLVRDPAPAVTSPPQPVGVHVLPSGAIVVVGGDGIWRSTDAGKSWQRTLTFPGSLHGLALGTAGTTMVATAATLSGTTTTVYESDDGLSWSSFVTSTSLRDYAVRLRGPGHDATGFAFLDPRMNTPMGRGSLLRTTDGGRHWTALKNAGVAGIAFVPGSSALIAADEYADDQPSSCDGHLVRSDDDGLTWHAIAGTCTGQNMYAVAFVDAQHGFAAGGSSNHYGGSQLFYATGDAGRTWHRVFTTGAVGGGGSRYPDTFSDLVPIDANDIYAATGACVGSAEGPCGDDVEVTHDGGRTWHDTGRAAVEISAADGLLATTGWAGGRPGASVSTDDGRTWRTAVAAPDLLLQQLSRSSAELLAETNAGYAASGDGGRTWQAYHPVPATARFGDLLLRKGSHGLIGPDPDAGRLGWSTDNGASWHASTGGLFTGEAADDVRLDPSDDVRAMAVAGAMKPCATDVFRSEDAGHSWQKAASLPFDIGDWGPHVIGYDDHVAAAVGQCGRRSYLAVSPDDGQHWTTTGLDQGYDLLAAGVADGSVWVDGADTKGNVVVLVSADRGHSWAAHELVGLIQPGMTQLSVLPLSSTEALISLNDGTFWRTTDAGASWHQERPDLVPDA